MWCWKFSPLFQILKEDIDQWASTELNVIQTTAFPSVLFTPPTPSGKYTRKHLTYAKLLQLIWEDGRRIHERTSWNIKDNNGIRRRVGYDKSRWEVKARNNVVFVPKTSIYVSTSVGSAYGPLRDEHHVEKVTAPSWSVNTCFSNAAQSNLI